MVLHVGFFLFSLHFMLCMLFTCFATCYFFLLYLQILLPYFKCFCWQASLILLMAKPHFFKPVTIMQITVEHFFMDLSC